MRAEVTENRLRFLLAGKATFTIKNERSGYEVDYTVMLSANTNRYYVVATKAHTHLGWIPADRLLYPDQTVTPVVQQLASYKGFWWYYKQLLIAEYDDPVCKDMDNALAFKLDFKLYHKGRCSRCYRELTDADSIARGMGPVCAKY
jgi:hypothetical protein